MHFRSINLFSKEFFINSLIGLLPFSFIAGNLSINLNVIILVLFTLFFFRKQFFEFKFNFTDKLILYFFTYLILVGTISTIYGFNFENLNDIKKLRNILGKIDVVIHCANLAHNDYPSKLIRKVNLYQ